MTPPSFDRLVDDYLTVRRGLGFDLETPEWQLRNFASYADRIGHSGPLTIALAVEWAQSSQSSNPAQAVRRLAAVRQFARHRALFEPATEVPPVGLLGRLPRRPPPSSESRRESPTEDDNARPPARELAETEKAAPAMRRCCPNGRADRRCSACLAQASVELVAGGERAGAIEPSPEQ